MKFKYYCAHCKKTVEGIHIDSPNFKELDSFQCYKCKKRLIVIDRVIKYLVSPVNKSRRKIK